MKIEPGKPVMMVGNMKLMKQLKKVIKMNMLRQFHRERPNEHRYLITSKVIILLPVCEHEPRNCSSETLT